MKTAILSLLILILTSCTATPTKTVVVEEQKPSPAETTPQEVKNCICVKMWLPVCGSNKKTYGNSCEADCAGVKYKQGACESKK